MLDASNSIWYTGQPFEMIVFANVVAQQNHVAVCLLRCAIRLDLVDHSANDCGLELLYGAWAV